ncbi:EAL domain-containing protein [uncultured Deinococcus sp.]|uniref:sensor domain-containing protein n=1 Tax=uncultured Deinococcus sp. TaxID=158789 RepID=UPI0025D3C325|nr:EAL domain-containing protein [uncultured Deinococcus sp.]
MFTVVFQHTRQGMALVGLDGRFVTVNAALARMLGVPLQELPGQRFQDFTHPDDRPADEAALRGLTGGTRQEYAVIKRYVPRTGGVIWVDVYVATVTDEQGAPAFFVTQMRDITHERAQAEQIQVLGEQLDVAIQATEDGVWDWEVGEPCVHVTSTWNALMNRAGAGRDVTMRWWWRHLHPDDRSAVRSQVEEHLSGARPKVDVLHRVILGDGTWRWLALRGRVVKRTPDGQPARVAGTLTDMEDRMQTQQDLQVLLDHLPAMIGYWDATLHNRFGNQRYSEWFGKRAEVLRGRHISEVLGPDTYQRNRPFIERALRGEPQAFERRVTIPDGRVLDTQVQYIPDMRGQAVRGFYVLGTDITSFRRTQQELDEQRELARITLDSIGDGVITTNPDGRVTFMNPVAQRLTGWREEDARGCAIETVLPLVEPQHNRTVLNPLRVALRHQTVVGLSSDAVLRSRLGAVAHIEDSAAPIFSPSGDVLGGVIVFHDVTEKQALAQRMSHLARHDHLTGLPNRTTLLEHVAAMVAPAGPQPPLVAVLFVDLDEFKLVNDTLGHHVGDELLREVATRLQQELRGADVVARYGGDEFLIVLGDHLTAPDVHAVAERLLRRLHHPFQLSEHAPTVSSSIGVALYPQDGTTAETLIRHADAAMYRAKADGGNCVRFFDAALNDHAREQQSMMAALRAAVHDEQFHLVYQPQVNARTGDLLGAEALLRWTRPDGVAVPPGTFIPLAERSGVMTQLGTWVLREAVRQAQDWHARGLPIRVAVNVSAVQFADPAFVTTVQDVLTMAQLPPHLLELEVTESLLLHDIPRVLALLRDLKALGVALSLDDFGTGYSSLSYLHDFPIDTLKIDRSFMPTPDRPAHTILSAIVGLGQALGLHVIAEGVETLEQQRLLLQLGCERMQGYLYARPMRPEGLAAWYAEWIRRT